MSMMLRNFMGAIPIQFFKRTPRTWPHIPSQLHRDGALFFLRYWAGFNLLTATSPLPNLFLQSAQPVVWASSLVRHGDNYNLIWLDGIEDVVWEVWKDFLAYAAPDNLGYKRKLREVGNRFVHFYNKCQSNTGRFTLVITGRLPEFFVGLWLKLGVQDNSEMTRRNTSSAGIPCTLPVRKSSRRRSASSSHSRSSSVDDGSSRLRRSFPASLARSSRSSFMVAAEISSRFFNMVTLHCVAKTR